MNIRRFIILFFIIFACLGFSFFPALTVPYVSHDNVRYFHKFFNEDPLASIDPQSAWISALGRPLASRLETIIYHRIDHLSDLAWLRAITLAVYALSATLLAVIAVSAGLEVVPAICLSVAIFTLPGVQECVFMPFLANALPVLFSLLAYVIWMGTWVKGVRFLLAFFLLEAGFFLYATSSLFFLIPTAFFVIFSTDKLKASRKGWLRDVAMWLLAALVYWVALKVFFYSRLRMTGHEVNVMPNALLAHVKTFFSQCVFLTFNFWNIYYSQFLGEMLAFFTAVILIGQVFYVKRSIAVSKVLTIVAIFLICNITWFIFPVYFLRVYQASQALALVLIYWACQWLSRKWVLYNRSAAFWWSGIFLLTGLLAAHITMNDNVLNSNAQLMFIRSRLAQHADSSTPQVHLVWLKDDRTGYNGLRTVHDNFNISYLFKYEIPDLIRAALKDNDIPGMRCIVTVSEYSQSYKLRARGIVINMNDLTLGRWKGYINRNFDRPQGKDVHPAVLDPSDVDDGLYADHYAGRGQYALAIAEYDKAIDIDPFEAIYYHNRGCAYYKLGNYRLALSDLDQALSLDPRFVEAYYNRSVVYMAQRDFTLGLQDLQKAMAINPNDSRLYGERGLIYQGQGRQKLALADFDKALALNANDAKAYEDRGIFYADQGSYAKAIIDLDRAIFLKPDNADAYRDRAICYFKLRDYVRSRDDVKKARALGAAISPQFINDLKVVLPI